MVCPLSLKQPDITQLSSLLFLFCFCFKFPFFFLLKPDFLLKLDQTLIILSWQLVLSGNRKIMANVKARRRCLQLWIDSSTINRWNICFRKRRSISTRRIGTVFARLQSQTRLDLCTLLKTCDLCLFLQASLESEEGRRRMVNPTVQATCRNGSLVRVITLMNKCVSPESLSRPSFEDILWNLQYASQLQAASDGDQC